MALDFDATYTPRSNAADADYPFGSFKNRVTPLTGTPFDEDWANDWLGFTQKLLDFGNITPSGVPDTILASDFFDGMVKRINQLSQYLVDSGAADAYVVSGDPAYTAYFAGMKIRVKITNVNAGASNINVDSLGSKSIVKFVSTPLVAGDLPLNAIVEMQYDGTSFQIQNVHNANPTFTSLILSGAPGGTPVANTLYKDNIVKGWIRFDGIGVIAIEDSFNVSSILDNGGTGDYTVFWDLDFANDDYAAVPASGQFHTSTVNPLVGSIDILTFDNSHSAADSAGVSCIAVGDQ